MRLFLSLLSASVLFLAIACEQSVSVKPQPNIILIMADDLGWFDTGFNGNRIVKTPHLDRLAKEGIILNRFYAASAVCSPTRASVLTGRNPLRMNIPNANSGHMLEEEITIPELLKQKNYRTGHFGKWHLGTFTKEIMDANRGGRIKHNKHLSVPTKHGYDEYFCTESKVPTYDPMIYPSNFEKGESKRFGWRVINKEESSIDYGTAYWGNGPAKITKNLEGSNARVIMDRVIPFIDVAKKESQPFFTTIWFHTPHLPVVADSTYRSMYAELSEREQLYYGCITAMDDQIGRLWDKLEELGEANNTMLWFCSDNGPERDTPGSAGVFRERKRSLYEGGVRVPAFVVWKNKIDGGQKMNLPCVTSDYLPTIASVINASIDKTRPIDGIDILPLLTQKDSIRDKPIGFIYPKYEKIAWITDRYKLISTDSLKTLELYDLLNDKEENNNIANSHKKLKEELSNDLDDWLISVKKSSNGEDFD